MIVVADALQCSGSPLQAAVFGNVISAKSSPNTLFAQKAERLLPKTGWLIVVYSPMRNVFEVPSVNCFALTGDLLKLPIMQFCAPESDGGLFAGGGVTITTGKGPLSDIFILSLPRPA